MIEVKKEKLIYYFETAKKYKDEIKSPYNKTFDYTDTSFVIQDSTTKGQTLSREVDSVILKSINFLANFIMSSVFSKTGSWATVKISEEALKKLTGISGESVKTVVDSINKILEENSNTVYLAIDTTNYYTETNKALLDCIKVGTGIRKTIFLKSNTKPFTYSYQNLDNIYILEDNLGVPNVIFKRYLEKNLEDINDLFGYLSIKTPSSLTDENNLEEKINLIESVVGIFDESTSRYKYYHSVHTDDFEELLVEEELNYNPYTVFRWAIDSSNPWGIGIGRANLNLFEELKNLKEKRKKHIGKIVNPPLKFIGNIDLINKVSLEENYKNYGGSGYDGDNFTLEPLNIGTNLIPIEKDIEDCRNRIREVFMAQPLGDVGDTKNRSATEMSLRHEMFRKEFSGTYELINTELLEPTFMNAYHILEEKGLLKQDEKFKAYTSVAQIQYINELTRSAGSEDVANTISFFNMLSGVISDEERKLIFKTEKLIEWSAKKMRVPLEVLNSAEEIQKILAEQKQLMQMQQMALIQENLGKKADTGIQDYIQQGVDEIAQEQIPNTTR